MLNLNLFFYLQQNDYETDNPNLYLIDYGQVEVYFKDNVLRTIEGHKTFGEREFFLNIPYEFTIKSATFTMGYKIPRKFFINLLKGYPEQYVSFFSLEILTIYYIIYMNFLGNFLQY